jgi:hypothetical protein
MVRKHPRASAPSPFLICAKIILASQTPLFGSEKNFIADKKGDGADSRRWANAVQTVPG